MGLISVNGVNPFENQPDPYISMDSSIDYSNNPEGEIINSYALEGVLTGCDKQDLNRLRDGLVASFDWKAKPSITENIQIHGGIGFTWEYDAQFYYRRSKLLALTLGSPMRWKERLVSAVENEQAVAAGVN